MTRRRMGRKALSTQPYLSDTCGIITCVASRPRDKAELLARLNEQLEFLDDSAQRFDDGKEAEYARLAVIVRVLVHDTKSSKSLLAQLGVKHSLKYINTGPATDTRNLLSQQTLVLLIGGGEPNTKAFEAPLDKERARQERISPRLGFGQWWKMGVILEPQKLDPNADRKGFSRADLILTVSNKEGGAHIDPDIPEEWYRLTRENSMGWERFWGPIVIPAGSPVPASIRQVSYELSETIRDQVEGAT